jgi:hypothetical protein
VIEVLNFGRIQHPPRGIRPRVPREQKKEHPCEKAVRKAMEDLSTVRPFAVVVPIYM